MKQNNPKPAGSYTKQELIDLEHEWRLKLKASGFEDVEKWDNQPRKKKQEIVFIKDHIRPKSFGKKYSFIWDPEQTKQFYRVIGLYAHHAPPGPLIDKYREYLKDYAMSGFRTVTSKNLGNTIKPNAVEMYLHRHFHEMLEFVNNMEKENDKPTKGNRRRTY